MGKNFEKRATKSLIGVYKQCINYLKPNKKSAFYISNLQTKINNLSTQLGKN